MKRQRPKATHALSSSAVRDSLMEKAAHVNRARVRAGPERCAVSGTHFFQGHPELETPIHMRLPTFFVAMQMNHARTEDKRMSNTCDCRMQNSR